MKRDETEYKHYTPEEILQILIDFYNFQAYFCLDADAGHQLTFQTTIREWRKICNQEEPAKLAEYLQSFFNLNTNQSELINLISNEDNTLGIFCNYLANNAIKPVISSGSLCLETAIFETLKIEFERKGIDITDFTPSTDFTVLFYKHAEDIMSIVSKLAPGTLSYYKLKYSVIDKLGALLMIFSIVTPIVMILFYHIIWHIITPLFIVTITLVLINKKTEQFKSDISGYRTIKDLIIGMKKHVI